MRGLRNYISLFILMMSYNASLNAQSGGYAGEATRLGFSPKTMAMSNAMTATQSQGIYPYYNPAFAALYADYVQFDLSVAALQFDRVYQTSGLTFKLPPNAGLAVNIIRSGVNDIDQRSVSGYPEGLFGTSEFQMMGAFGLRISSHLLAGIAFKLNYADLHEDLQSSSSVGIDLGMLYEFTPEISFGFTVQDLFAEYSWDSAPLYQLNQSRPVTNNFPTRIKSGISIHKQQQTFSLDYEVKLIKADFLETVPGDSGPTEILNSSRSSIQQMRVGYAWELHERLTLRSGFSLPDLSASASWGASAGFSLHLPFDKYAPSVDYAFVLEPNRISQIHMFALSLKL